MVSAGGLLIILMVMALIYCIARDIIAMMITWNARGTNVPEMPTIPPMPDAGSVARPRRKPHVDLTETYLGRKNAGRTGKTENERYNSIKPQMDHQ